MTPFAATLAVAAPLVLAGEQSLFHLPSEEDVRLQPITRADNEADWPFTVDAGQIACVWSGGQKVAMFLERRPDALEDHEEFTPRSVMLSVNPFELTVMNIGNRGLLAHADSVETLIKRIAPYVTVAQRLCDQPRGARVGHGEL
ncbi:hypothetical protein [Parvibaculum sp.]|uniref:hypothetical protein n=1 Tax=Parvibaculum sp. TaxID=2024848 RepID=UPI003BAC94DA